MSQTPFNFIGYDSETKRMREGVPYPEMVCGQIAPEGSKAFILSSSTDRETLVGTLTRLLEDPLTRFVTVNGSYDTMVLCLEFPELLSLIWQSYADGKWIDASTASKMAHLAEGLTISSSDAYSAQGLAHEYLGKDRSDSKSSGVRTTFDTLIGVPVPEWPQQYIEYALDDAEDPVQVWRAIESKDTAPDLGLLGFRACKHFALAWINYIGMRTRPQKVMELMAEVDSQLDASNFPKLIQWGRVWKDGSEGGSILGHEYPAKDDRWTGTGVLIPAQPPRPAKRNKIHVEGCTKKGCDCPPQMLKGKDEVFSRKKFAELVLSEARRQGTKVALTDKGKLEARQIIGKRKFRLEASSEYFDQYPAWVATDHDSVQPLCADSEILQEWERRQKYIKLRTDYLHRFVWDYPNDVPLKQHRTRMAEDVPKGGFSKQAAALSVVPRMRFPFSDLVSSGRVSGRAGNKYASMNGQNPHPKVRPLLEADPGWWLYSTDYNSQDLRSFAWRCKTLGIPSRYLELYEAGECPHLYLAAYMAQSLEGWGSEHLESAIPEVFKRLYETTNTSDAAIAHYKWAKNWRTFSKVIGLGCCGGMGAATMREQARGYGLGWVTVEDCRKAIQVWRRLFPEYKAYFQYIKDHHEDKPFSKKDEDSIGGVRRRFWYRTPLGMLRRNVAWTEVCNGFALQSPSAEGAGVALFQAVRECVDPAMESVLYGSWVMGFLHDEILYQVDASKGIEHTEACRLRMEAIMRDGLASVVQVPQQVETACMLVWDKAASPKFNERGQMIPWDMEATS